MARGACPRRAPSPWGPGAVRPGSFPSQGVAGVSWCVSRWWPPFVGACWWFRCWWWTRPAPCLSALPTKASEGVEGAVCPVGVMPRMLRGDALRTRARRAPGVRAATSTAGESRGSPPRRAARGRRGNPTPRARARRRRRSHLRRARGVPRRPPRREGSRPSAAGAVLCVALCVMSCVVVYSRSLTGGKFQQENACAHARNAMCTRHVSRWNSSGFAFDRTALVFMPSSRVNFVVF